MSQYKYHHEVKMKCSQENCENEWTQMEPKRPLCQTCFMGEYAGIFEKNNKNSKWKTIKRYTYYFIPYFFITLFIGREFGLTTQLIAQGYFIVALFYADLMNWLADIF